MYVGPCRPYVIVNSVISIESLVASKYYRMPYKTVCCQSLMSRCSLYCIVSEHLYSVTHSLHQSKALPVQETLRTFKAVPKQGKDPGRSPVSNYERVDSMVRGHQKQKIWSFICAFMYVCNMYVLCIVQMFVCIHEYEYVYI